jgi:hypothetical protein
MRALRTAQGGSTADAIRQPGRQGLFAGSEQEAAVQSGNLAGYDSSPGPVSEKGYRHVNH